MDHLHICSILRFRSPPDTCVNKHRLNCLNEGYLSPGKPENGFICHCVCPPTHRGELCEERIADDYYESMNVTLCGGRIDKSDQLIEQAANSTPCAWTIAAPENQFIQIEFEHFALRPRFKSKLNNSAVNNRCLYESLELRTEDHYNGHHFCADDIKPGQRIESKRNIMLLIVHTYSRLQTNSDGFRAKVRFLDRTDSARGSDDKITTAPSSSRGGFSFKRIFHSLSS